MKEFERHQFNNGDRGDRLHPKRFDRSYWHLTLLYNKLRSVVNGDLLPPGEQVLDFGCGNQPYRSLLETKFKRYVGADLPGNQDAELLIGPRGQLPCGDYSFDCVLSSEVLEHTANPRLYLSEAYRVLRAGGSLVLSVPAIWVYHPDPIDYWRWTIAGLQFEIRDAGFELIKVYGVFGPESSALQLWQDSTFERLPRALRPLYTWFFQSLIGLIERRQPDKLSNDASCYIVLARKPNGNDAGCMGSEKLNERQPD